MLQQAVRKQSLVFLSSPTQGHTGLCPQPSCWQHWPHWLLQPWCGALAQGRNRHRTFSCSLEISLPHLLPFPFPSCSDSLEATAPPKQGLSIQAVCSLGLARNDPALGSHLAAGFTSCSRIHRFSLPAPHPSTVSWAILWDLLCSVSYPHTSIRTPVPSSLLQFLTCCFFDVNFINLEWTFLGFPASHKATGTPKLISC